MPAPASKTALTTLTVKKGASVASLSLKRYEDGSISFTKTNGRTAWVHSDQHMKALFDAINALV